MTWYIVVFVFITLLGAFTLSYQIYKLTELDASCRGLKHPKFWGVFALGGNNGSGGLLLYLLGRRKYPAQISETDALEMNSRKKKASVSLIFIAVGAVCLIVTVVFTM
ncbi:hypothetical protein NXH76_11025 [Blautia schinkii]|nr:hypothetical protein [Blautia schinkii]